MGLKEDWALWGMPVFAAILAPWHEKLPGIQLISTYFQPKVSVAGSLVGLLFAMASYGLVKSTSVWRQRSLVYWTLSAFILAILICLALKYIIAPGMVPTPVMQRLIWAVWILAYLAVFSFLSASLMTAFVLVRSQPGEMSRIVDGSAGRLAQRVKGGWR